MLPKRRTIRFEKLLDEMRQRDPQRQEDAFFQLEPRAGEFVDELVEAFHAERERDHGLACWLLELLGASKSPQAIPLLVSVLADADEAYRYWGEWGLKEIDTKEARTALYIHRRGA